ncbi:MAG: putative DNA modification/repair radical SAM protein [Clostridiales bacterium]|nr:putative DNA modification/repair radical SAM protein [Clostridiales bacterium]
MDIFEKLKILTDAAKYDVACTSSGVDRTSPKDGVGSAASCGICHTFSADGRCVSLLKILMSNVCAYDCEYCVNRKSNDTPRATFTPREIAELTIGFYRRNYIEGLFLSSAVLGDPTNTVEHMCEALRILREEYRFYGYIHAKAIPGADEDALYRLGLYADRMSVNIELPSEQSLKLLAPSKTRASILTPMGFIRDGIKESRAETAKYRHAPKFVSAGQSTQMIVGASGESDAHILRLSEGLYNRYALKRVFYSAYVPTVSSSRLPAIDVKPPLLREHRLYQADWLLRYYGFTADELLSGDENFDLTLDPKCHWALTHTEFFPVDVNRAPYEALLRVPGIGVKSAKRIVSARRVRSLDLAALKKIGVVLKRAKYFIDCGHRDERMVFSPSAVLHGLLSDVATTAQFTHRQLSLCDEPEPSAEETQKSLLGQF